MIKKLLLYFLGLFSLWILYLLFYQELHILIDSKTRNFYSHLNKFVNSDLNEITVSKLTDFKWDKFCVLVPYASGDITNFLNENGIDTQEKVLNPNTGSEYGGWTFLFISKNNINFVRGFKYYFNVKEASFCEKTEKVIILKSPKNKKDLTITSKGE